MDISTIIVKNKPKAKCRLGRGSGSGKGKTASRGHKGAGQRKGKVSPYLGFSGGNLPFFRKIPKRGFNSPRRRIYQIINLDRISECLSRLEKENTIDPSLFKKFNLIKDENKPVKILSRGGDKFSHKITLKAHKFSKKAKEIIEKVGGKVEYLTGSETETKQALT